MDLKIVWYVLGRLSWAYGCGMVLPLAVSLWYSESSIFAFAVAIGVCLALGKGLTMYGTAPAGEVTNREGIAITALGWIMVMFLGMVPYAAGGYLSVLDGVFECISGLSGTGATVIPDLEIMPQGILLWRSLTHWFGGLGIIVIFIALFPQLGRGTVHMFNAESTGPTSDRNVPRVKEMAKALFCVYVVFTTAAALACMACGMSFLIALNHACSTIATGGFSPYNTSVAYFDSPLIEGVLAFFMMISSANFGMYVAAWKRGPKVILHDTEFRTYVGLVAAATVLMAANLASAQGWAWSEAFRQSFFQAASLSSSTGFISSDFDKWPAFSQFILVFLIFVGGCAGSTAGGLKVTRLMLLAKTIVLRIRQKMHPHIVLHVRSNGEDFSEDVLYGVARFFFVYVMLDILWTVLLVFDGIPIFDALGVAITTMGSCGPSFGLFGATCTYADMPSFSKAVVCLSMLMGRLEIFPVLALLMPSFWKHRVW